MFTLGVAHAGTATVSSPNLQGLISALGDHDAAPAGSPSESTGSTSAADSPPPLSQQQETGSLSLSGDLSLSNMEDILNANIEVTGTSRRSSGGDTEAAVGLDDDEFNWDDYVVPQVRLLQYVGCF